MEGLFANAGLTGGFTPSGLRPEMFEQTLRVKVTSVFWAAQKVLPARDRGEEGRDPRHRQMGSKRGMAMNPAYVASKHGVLGLTRAIADEMGSPPTSAANCIIPGFIRTEALDRIPPEQQGKIERHIPMRRMGGVEELAEVAAFLLSDAACHVTGQDPGQSTAGCWRASKFSPSPCDGRGLRNRNRERSLPSRELWNG